MTRRQACAFNGSMTTTTHTQPVRSGAVVFDAVHPNATQAHRTVVADVHEAYVLDRGEFLVQSYAGYVTIGRLTGRTRHCWGIACPTVERYNVHTVANAEGVILGVKGERIAGSFAVRPEYLVQVTS